MPLTTVKKTTRQPNPPRQRSAMASEMVFVLSCPPDAATRLDIEDFAVSVCDEARKRGWKVWACWTDAGLKVRPSAEWQGAIATRIYRDIRKQRNQARGNDVRSGETAARHIDT